MSYAEQLQQADLDTAELGTIAAWCLSQLAEELSEVAFPSEATEVLTAIAPSVSALGEGYVNAAVNFGSCEIPEYQTASNTLGVAAALSHDLHRAHQYAEGWVQAAGAALQAQHEAADRAFAATQRSVAAEAVAPTAAASPDGAHSSAHPVPPAAGRSR